MFTSSERKPLHDPCFKIVFEQSDCVVVTSKDTRDTWRVRVEDGWIVTDHMPSGQRRYHRQCRSATIASAVKKIRKHDKYVMHGRYGMGK